MNALEEAIVGIANVAWETGANGSTFCLTPSYFAGPNESSLQDDVVINELNVTHFTLAWEDRGETVKITFYEADAFGACPPWEMKQRDSFIVNLKTNEVRKVETSEGDRK